MKEEINKIVAWLQDQVKDAGASGLVFGLSGGIDSAVVAGLAKRAFSDNALALIMPIHSDDRDAQDARLVAEKLNLKTKTIDLSKTYDQYLKDTFTSDNLMARSNIKPRLRMLSLYYYAQDLGYLVAGCSNASEFYTGYFTKYGDSGADVIPLANFLKDEVYDLARELEIPAKIIDKAPSAGLFEDQSDEKEMGFSYKDLNSFIRGKKVAPKIEEKIKRMHKNSEHKRVFAKIYKRDK